MSASARKFPERLFSPIQRTPESFPTLPPEISRFPFGTKVIKILDLSPYLPPTRPFAVSPALSYSPKPVLHQPRHPPESAPLIHQSPCTFYPHLTLSYNNTHQSSSSLPTITKFAFPTVPSALLSFLFPKASPSPTTPPDRIHFSHSSISLHVLSSSHPVLQQHSSVQFITNHATRPNPILSFINRLARSILISPCLTTTLISPVHHFLQSPSSLSRQAHPHCYPSYSPKPVLHQPRHQTESAPLVHQSPCTFYPHFTLSYNNSHQSSSSLPTITKFAFPTGHHALFSFSLAI